MLMLGTLMVMPIILLPVVLFRRLRVGWDGQHLHLVGLRNRVEKILPTEVIDTGRRIVGKKVAVSYSGNGRNFILEQAPFEHYIQPQLVGAQRLGEFALFMRQLRHKEPMAWLQVVMIFVALLVLIKIG